MIPGRGPSTNTENYYERNRAPAAGTGFAERVCAKRSFPSFGLAAKKRKVAPLAAPPPGVLLARPSLKAPPCRVLSPERRISPTDVLLGGGPKSQGHIGNAVFHSFVQTNLQAFLQVPRTHQVIVVQKVIDLVKTQQPPGRFFEYDDKTGNYIVASEQIVVQHVLAAHSLAAAKNVPSQLAAAPEAVSSTPVRMTSRAARKSPRVTPSEARPPLSGLAALAAAACLPDFCPSATKKSVVLPPVKHDNLAGLDLPPLPEELVQFFANGRPRSGAERGTVVRLPHQFDILFGRGSSVVTHPGNSAFRLLCWLYKEAYNRAHRNDKRRIANAVVQKFKQANPPSRFLEQLEDGYSWVDAGEERLLEKASQGLRERKWKSKPQLHRPRPRPWHEGDEDDEAAAPDAAASSPSTLPDNVQEGAAISIYWPLDRAYYSGVVAERSGDHVVINYNDGMVESLDLTKHQYQLHER